MTAPFYALVDELKSVQSVSELLSWHRPKATGAVVGVLLSTILFYHFMDYTLVTFACRVFQLLFAVGAACGFLNKYRLEPSEIQRAVDCLAERVTPCTASAIERAQDILTWRDYVLSAKVFCVTLLVAFVGNFISDVLLCVLVIVVAFTLPLVYEKKRTQIDSFVNDARTQFDKYFGKFMTNVEKTVKKTE